MANQLLISFIGPSGSGKSTCYNFAEKYLSELGYQIFRCDVAYPLRLLQNNAYLFFELGYPGDPYLPDKYKQDGVLLGFLAKHFENRLSICTKNRVKLLLSYQNRSVCIINTDCRNNAYQDLADLGFIFIKLEVDQGILKQRRLARRDTTNFDYSASVEQFDKITPQLNIPNNGSLENLEREVRSVIDKILKG